VPRGFEWCVYEADDHQLFAVQVDADYQLQTGRGFETLAPEGALPVPRGWLIRKVVGVEPLGREHMATVASVTAPLWTGVETTFDIVDSNGDVQTCTVTRWLAERSKPRP